MKKLSIGFLGLGAMLFMMLLVFGMMNDSRQRMLDEDMAKLVELKSSMTPIETPTPPKMEKKAEEQSMDPTRTDSMQDWIEVMDSYRNMTGFHSQTWNDLSKFYFRRIRIPEWPKGTLEDLVPIVNDAQPFILRLKKFVATHGAPPFHDWCELDPDRNDEYLLAAMAVMLHVDAILWAEKKDSDRAFDSIFTGIRLSESYLDFDMGRWFPRRYYRQIFDVSTEALEEAFPPGSLTDQQLNRWFIATHDAHERESFMEDYQQHTHSAAVQIHDHHRRNLSAQGLGDALRAKDVEGKIWNSAKWMHDVTIGRKKTYSWVDQKILIAKAAATLSPGPLYETLTKMTAPSEELMYPEFREQAEFEAQLDLTTIGLLIEQYKRKNGEYPDSLRNIQMPFSKNVPKDVFTGIAYQYKVKEESFTLYSAGKPEKIINERWKNFDPVIFRMYWRARDFQAPAFDAPSEEEWAELLTGIQ
jgi:hypothetical protein